MTVDLNLVRTIIGIVGNVISFGLFAAQAPIFYKIIKKKGEADLSPDRYLDMIQNCALWIFYGLPIVSLQNILVSIMNGVGLVMAIAYILTYCKYAGEKQRRYVAKGLAVAALGYTIIVVFTLTSLPTISKRTGFVGCLCMYKALSARGGKVKNLPVFLLFANVLNGLTWMTYGLLGPFDTNFEIFISFGDVVFTHLFQICKKPKTTDASTDIEKTLLPM